MHHVFVFGVEVGPAFPSFPSPSMARQIIDKQSAIASRFSSGLLFETMWHCDTHCKMWFITCQWSLAVCSLGLLMRRSTQSSALARSVAWRWTPVDHNSGLETRKCVCVGGWGGLGLSLWGCLAAGSPNPPVKIISTLGCFTAVYVGTSQSFGLI